MLWYIGAGVVFLVATTIIALAWLAPSGNSSKNKKSRISQPHSKNSNDDDIIANPAYFHLENNIYHHHLEQDRQEW